MALTRQTALFAEFAALVEMELEWVGATISSDLVDTVLNAHVEHIAQSTGVSPRQALDDAASDLGAITARSLLVVMEQDLEDTSEG
ncbi:hypothetical protein ACFS27_12765 [Promicromonospora vindobonensis]|uniref:Uncharacterized protein n=1 Tax=Promicromonospora vindobonensis TaxID=195748 RepID=A0ABW5VV74_9MICO